MKSEKQLKETEKRMEDFRKGVEELIKKYNVGMQAEIQVTNKGITPGIVLVDLKNDESVVEHTDESKKVVIEPNKSDN